MTFVRCLQCVPIGPHRPDAQSSLNTCVRVCVSHMCRDGTFKDAPLYII